MRSTNSAPFCALCATISFFILQCAAKTTQRTHYNNLIVGGGPAGLYTAWRLSSPSGRPNESTAIYEWSAERLGGRIFTKKFPGGQYLELGGMRFLDEHQILGKVLERLDLKKYVIDFPLTDNRLYYIRGKHVYASDIETEGVPYRTDVENHRYKRPEELLDLVADSVFGGKRPNTTDEWCRFFDNATIPSPFNSTAYKPGDGIGNIGFWNLLLDQLGSEAFHYVSDANGYTANVINKNAASAIHVLSEFAGTPKFKTLTQGLSLLIKTLAYEIRKQSVTIVNGHRMTEFHWNAINKKFVCTFVQYDKDGNSLGRKTVVTSDNLFLCMPKHSIDLIRENHVVGSWPSDRERKVLKNSRGRYYIESIIQQPAYKIGLLYEKAWWMDADFPPCSDGICSLKTDNLNYGPTVTDLPLRQIYYIGNNRPTAYYTDTHYGILASYDDTHFTKFWRVLEKGPNETVTKPSSEDLQPLSTGSKVPPVMLDIVQKQLNMVHFHSTQMKVPSPIAGYFMNWDLNPFKAGYHAWKPHYKLAEAQYFMTRPGDEMDVPIFVAGSAYSNAQGWVEGAFTTAESILVDRFKLPPITQNYTLICRPQ